MGRRGRAEGVCFFVGALAAVTAATGCGDDDAAASAASCVGDPTPAKRDHSDTSPE